MRYGQLADIVVTDSMVQAALDRLNRLGGGERDEDGNVTMHWGDMLREAYVAMEKQRRADFEASLPVKAWQ